MKELPLTKGYVALVDDEDFDRVARYKWQSHVRNHTVYAGRHFRGPKTKTNPSGQYCIWLHREITNAPEGMDVDHKNHNGLDNQKHNLKVCPHIVNAANRKDGSKHSQFFGVSWNRRASLWIAQIKVNGKLHSLGYHKNEIDAAKAFNAAALEFRGEKAVLNVF